jgi:hypothetical protein
MRACAARSRSHSASEKHVGARTPAGTSCTRSISAVSTTPDAPALKGDEYPRSSKRSGAYDTLDIAPDIRRSLARLVRVLSSPSILAISSSERASPGLATMPLRVWSDQPMLASGADLFDAVVVAPGGRRRERADPGRIPTHAA